ncbi:MAG: Response regulator containing a CheY-like receiver domain and an HTH DNA-binding [Rhodospirillaceae bacterium]|nr:MAG: Response regulator containing a CheY-like receiver domain and an HTH DNA-binding [Rhodospirillaceae bacterium]TNC98788.1 MAG: Response regulator containing a CheY-like receiver domain and an HTH DNA-binding domain [Stygiobacter sp.]
MTDRLRIVFIDDEPHVLRGLRRSMHEMDDQWRMEFFESGSAALDWLQRNEVDVVVTDMRMPGMDGAQVLASVRKHHPQAIRVILSGYAETASVLKTVEQAHIYLAKPCDPQSLKAAITRPLALRRFLSDPALLSVIGGLSNLPSLPGVITQLMAELARPDASATSVAAILGRDMAMTAEILKLTNSAFFALPAQVTSALQAVKTLGMETVQSLALHVGLFRQLDIDRVSPTALDDLTRYSLEMAALAEAVALADGAADAVGKAAYCAAMLSPIGSLVLLDHAPDRYAEAMALVGPHFSHAQAEQKVFGTSHPIIGAYLLGLWGFADSIVEAVAFAAAPAAAPTATSPVLLAAHVAQALGPPFPLLPAQTPGPDRLDMAYLIDIRKDGRVRHWRQLAAERRERLG